MEKSYQLCLLLLLFFFSCHGMGKNTTEMETLLAFKHHFITSDPNNALGGWNSSSPLSNVSGNMPALLKLNLGKNNQLPLFHGSLSLSNVSGIQKLNLPRNLFHGSLPLLGNMPALLKLNLGKNKLSSSTQLNELFFDSLTNCTLLEELSISNNQLAGSLPLSTANLSVRLQEINIDGNLFSGSFPQGMHNFRNLTILDLSQNLFVGSIPKSLASLHNLQMLFLSQNRFGGEIPDIFSNLTWLYRLNLSHNLLFGRIPRSIGDCQHLETLDLSTNDLTGNIPKEIFSQRSLTFILSLARNSLYGFLPLEVGKLDKVQAMNFSDNQLSGPVPVTMGDCASLQNLAMARNRFEGPIPKSLAQLVALESLDLSSNHFTGVIPDGLGKLKYLQKLNLSFNHLQGLVPAEGGVFMNLSWSALQGNKALCSENRTTQRQLRITRCGKGDGYSSLALKISLPISSVAALFCFLLCLKRIADTCRIQKLNARRWSYRTSFTRRHRKISYKEISSATDNFSSRNLIGRGSFGSVYKGILRVQNANAEDVVAIKVLDRKQNRASSSFAAECEILRNIRHRNLVKIITSCSSITPSGAEFKAILMKFMSNGSLDGWLHNPSLPTRLGLLERLNISIDVAAAMDYLHHDCDPPVVRCDLKPSNVLLDDEMTAHVGDFGLARCLSQPPSQQSQSSTPGLKGSIGYIAPEYNYGSRVSTGGDVYSYGMLLLEIFIGKKPTDKMFEDGFDLRNLASLVFENGIHEIVDKSLLEGENDSEVTISTSSNSSNNASSSSSSNNASSSGNMKHEEGRDWRSKKEKCLAALIRVALSCAADIPKNRPSMRDTLSRMHGIKGYLLDSERGIVSL